MPPTRSWSLRNLIEQDDRILLAIQAFKKQEIPSIREAARRFNVPHTTLQDRLHDHQNRGEARANNYKLTYTEEESLKKWILWIEFPRSSLRLLFPDKQWI